MSSTLRSYTLLAICEAGRWCAPLEDPASWNGFDLKRLKSAAQIDFYIRELRDHAMYRTAERLEGWPDYASLAPQARMGETAPSRAPATFLTSAVGARMLGHLSLGGSTWILP